MDQEDKYKRTVLVMLCLALALAIFSIWMCVRYNILVGEYNEAIHLLNECKDVSLMIVGVA